MNDEYDILSEKRNNKSLKSELKNVCTKCGKEMPIDHNKSSANWKVYKKHCKCGGTGKVVF